MLRIPVLHQTDVLTRVTSPGDSKVLQDPAWPGAKPAATDTLAPHIAGILQV